MFWKETDLQETFLKHTEISTIEAQLKEKKKATYDSGYSQSASTHSKSKF